MAIYGIAHVQVGIPPAGEDAARTFHGEVLALDEVPKPESLADRGGVWFRCGEQELHCGVEASVERRRAHPALLTHDLDGVRKRLEQAGAPVTFGRALPGYRRFYTEDPFGNRLELLEQVAAYT